MTQPPVLTAQDICKRFGRIEANSHVSLALHRGRVHALLGENGAGKSTLVSILYGLLPPDEGHIYIEGQPVSIRRPADAIQRGIGLVQQHFSLIPAFSVLDNILLGDESFWIDRRQAEEDIKRRLEPYHMVLPLHERIADLPVGIQQQVEIAKVLFRRARIMLFDEPTAALVSSEIESFLQTVTHLRQQDIAVVLVTHRLPEVMQAADDVTVLRKGKVVLQDELVRTTAEDLAEAIVGERICDESYDLPSPGEPVLDLQEVRFSQGPSQSSSTYSLQVHQGEMVGIAGVAGNGQEEFLDGLFGLYPVESGHILFAGEEITGCGWQQRKRKGIAYIPQDRIHQGLLLQHSVLENYLLNRDALEGRESFWIATAPVEKQVELFVSRYEIQTHSLHDPVERLSGGHQQRVILSREFSSHPRFIVAHDPTRGLDIHASRYVHELLIERCKAGAAILLFSSEWPELFLLCHRIAVMYRGSLIDIRKTDEWSMPELSRRMVGIKE